VVRVAPEVVTALSRYPWPGNVRELENLIERLVVMGTSAEIGLPERPAVREEQYVGLRSPSPDEPHGPKSPVAWPERGRAVIPSSSHADWFRSQLVVLSDRRPALGAPRTGLESAIEWALRRHDGVWLVRHSEAQSCAGGADAGSGEREGWSVLDGVPAEPRTWMDDWACYVRANAAYAERIIESVRPDGAVWINGHRWLLVAPALREHGHRGPIGLLFDVPFPAHSRLEVLPWYADLMSALCELDLLGFRARACADNFEACRVRAGQHRPRIEIFPKVVESTDRTDPAEWVTSFLQLLGSAARRDPRRWFIC
jgi:hypothetical protein